MKAFERNKHKLSIEGATNRYRKGLRTFENSQKRTKQKTRTKKVLVKMKVSSREYNGVPKPCTHLFCGLAKTMCDMSHRQIDVRSSCCVSASQAAIHGRNTTWKTVTIGLTQPKKIKENEEKLQINCT